jgi:uncharacterized protein YciI
MHYLMFYEFTADYLERRGGYRGEHLRYAWESQQRGELVLGGAFADPADSAALLFRCDSAQVPEAFARNDPYVKHGLVTGFRIRQWNTVVGADAITPVRAD